MVMPLVPRVSVFVPIPELMRTAPVLLKDSPSAAWAASRLTVCGVLTVVILKVATSVAPGFAGGSGVTAFEKSDHGPAEFQLAPVPSQRIFVADATFDKSASPRIDATKFSSASRVMKRH